ncbi:unnamed protein product, partial [marine sediment metagenome]
MADSRAEFIKGRGSLKSVRLDLGYKVEKGKIVGRLKDIMVSGNAYTMFNQVAALGREV